MTVAVSRRATAADTFTGLAHAANAAGQCPGIATVAAATTFTIGIAVTVTITACGTLGRPVTCTAASATGPWHRWGAHLITATAREAANVATAAVTVTGTATRPAATIRTRQAHIRHTATGGATAGRTTAG